MESGVDKMLGDLRVGNFADIRANSQVQYFIDTAAHLDLAGIKYPGTDVTDTSLTGCRWSEHLGYKPSSRGILCATGSN